MSYQSDDRWQKEYKAQVEAILETCLGKMAILRVATPEEDCKQATDYVLETSRGPIAVRVRDTRRDFRDLTLRSRRGNGTVTELTKIKKERFGRWYLYCWCRADGRLGDYILVDLDRLRTSGLLDVPRREFDNHDGTWFIAIPTDELREAGCLTVDACQSPAPRPRGDCQPGRSLKGKADAPEPGHSPERAARVVSPQAATDSWLPFMDQ